MRMKHYLRLSLLNRYQQKKYWSVKISEKLKMYKYNGRRPYRVIFVFANSLFSINSFPMHKYFIRINGYTYVTRHNSYVNNMEMDFFFLIVCIVCSFFPVIINNRYLKRIKWTNCMGTDVPILLKSKRKIMDMSVVVIAQYSKSNKNKQQV